MDVVFMGTPRLAVPILRALTTEHTVRSVYTRPDAVRGRGNRTEPSPVKAEAELLGIPVHTPASLRDPAVIEAIAAEEADVIVVAAYGMILPQAVLDAAPYGAINVHASLLPAWRGAAPIARSLLAGESETGVAIMRMEAGLDTGPFATTSRIAIGDAYLADLEDAVAEAGADALLHTLRGLESGGVTWTEQDDAAATYAEKMTAADVALDPALDAASLWRRVRASSDAVPARARIADTEVRVVRARPWTGEPLPAAGTVGVTKRAVVLGAADGALELETIVPAGRKPMAAADWARGARLESGADWGVSS